MCIRDRYQSGLNQYEQKKTQAYSELDTYYNSGFLTEEQYAAQKSALDIQFSEALSSLQASKAELDKNQAAIDEDVYKRQALYPSNCSERSIFGICIL